MVRPAPLAEARVLTALEHMPLAITSDGVGGSLTEIEADCLAGISEQRPGFCERGARHVKLAQYCGVVSLGNRILEILPKVDGGATSPEDCRGVLLRLLGRTERFAHFKHQAVGQHLRRMPLIEVFIATFFDSVASLARGGLLRQYQSLEEELQVVRGRIDLGRQFSVHANRPERLTCHFDDLTADNAWNRTLKKAIRCTRPWIQRAELHRQWIELMSVLNEVEDARLTSTELECLQFNRQAERYRVAVGWARWILSMLTPSLRAGAQQAPALLFEMNKLFESAVATVIGHKSNGMPGISVCRQDTSHALGKRNGIKPVYEMRPDLVIRREGCVIAIVDTKWKLLTSDRQAHLVPEMSDVYQMYAYASAFGCHDLHLVYPWHSGLVGSQQSEIHLPERDGRAVVLHVNCVDVESDELRVRCGKWPLTT